MAKKIGFGARFGLIGRPEDIERLYQEDREHMLLRVARWASSALVFGLSVYIYSDLFLSKQSANVLFRLPVIAFAVLFLVLSFVRFRKDPRGARTLFLVLLYGLVLMMTGILYNYARQGSFDVYYRGIQGLIVVLFATFAGMVGGARTYAPLYFGPIALLAAALTTVPGPTTDLLRALINPTMLSVGLVVMSEVLERLRRQAFEARQEADREKENLERILHLVLPGPVVEDLVKSGDTPPHLFPASTIMFTDFKDFTTIARLTEPEILIRELNRVFLEIDSICVEHGIEKIKTIGDAYMCAGGVPLENRTHALDICLSALRIRALIENMEVIGLIPWKIRIGVDSGPVMGGIVGRNRFTYDLWGNTVNIAQRMESASQPGSINISKSTYDQVGAFFECESRGAVPIKNGGEVDMFFLHRLRDDFVGPDPATPNRRFLEAYRELATAGG